MQDDRPAWPDTYEAMLWTACRHAGGLSPRVWQTTATAMSHASTAGAIAITIAPKITALQAQAAANLLLSNHVPDRFMAGPPRLDLAAHVWRVPVLLAYPIIGPVGQTGEMLVSVTAAEVVSATPLEAMPVAAGTLYEQHRHAIEAPVP